MSRSCIGRRERFVQQNEKLVKEGKKMMKSRTNLLNKKVAGKVNTVIQILGKKALKKEPGIDGILVTVGLCIIALLLCVVMKNSMTSFIQTIVDTLTTEAKNILTGVTGGMIL